MTTKAACVVGLSVVLSLGLACATVAYASAGHGAAGQERPRIFVTDSQSWTRGGARPQTAEIIKTVSERCRSALVTSDRTKAAFIVTLDHEGGKGVLRKRNKIAVFDAGGDLIYSGSTRSLGNAVEDACAAIVRSMKAAGK